MNYKIIETGSDGNATLVENKVLIDCGIPFSKIKNHYKNLELILLTHIHSDHFNKSTIKKLSELRPTLRFGCGSWLVDDLISIGIDKSRIDIYKFGTTYDYGSFKVEVFELYHDVPQLGYKLYWGDKKLFYATDTSTLKGVIAKDFDVYLVEANYKGDEELHNRAINPEYEERVKNTHMSEEDTIEWLLENMKESSIYEFMHQHKNRDIRLPNRFVQIAPLLERVSKVTKKKYQLDDYSIYNAVNDLLEELNERES